MHMLHKGYPPASALIRHCTIGLALCIATALSACDGGGGSSSDEDTTAPPSAAPTGIVIGTDVKTLTFSWDAVADATFYRLLQNPDGASGFSQIGTDLTTTSTTQTVAVHLFDWVNAQYMIEACNAGGCTGSSEFSVTDQMLDTIGYFKANNVDVDDAFGGSVALSADGTTLAVGATEEGGEGATAASDGGAVYIFTHSNNTWTQQAYLKANNVEENDAFGGSVALSADGTTLAIGAIGEDSVEDSSGAVYIFTHSNNTWTQQVYLKANNAGFGDQFGTSVALSADGTTLAVGATEEDGEGATAVNAGGAVYIFTHSNNTWTQQAYLKAYNAGDEDIFGTSLALSPDGTTLAIGASGEMLYSGAFYLY